MRFYTQSHALYMRAIHGGKAKNDRIDAQKIAMLLRGGMFPIAYVYPRAMRATRDLLRRRMHLMRKRSELLAHIHNTNSQYNLPEIRLNLRYQRNRAGIAERFDDPSVARSMELDLTLIDVYDRELKQVEWFILKHARKSDQHGLVLLRTVPGIGEILSLVMLYEIHDINRFESVQDFASYCRLVKCSHESAGKKKGTGGAKICNAHLKWAFSEAAIHFIQYNPPAKKLKDNLAKVHGKGKAIGIIAHKLARAIYYMLKNNVPFNLEKFMTTA